MNTLSMTEFKELLPLLIPLVLIQLGFMIFCLIKVLKQSHFKHFNKVVWLIIIVFFQFVGPISYLIVERGDSQ